MYVVLKPGRSWRSLESQRHRSKGYTAQQESERCETAKVQPKNWRFLHQSSINHHVISLKKLFQPQKRGQTAEVSGFSISRYSPFLLFCLWPLLMWFVTSVRCHAGHVTSFTASSWRTRSSTSMESQGERCRSRWKGKKWEERVLCPQIYWRNWGY